MPQLAEGSCLALCSLEYHKPIEVCIVQLPVARICFANGCAHCCHAGSALASQPRSCGHGFLLILQCRYMLMVTVLP